MQQIATANVQRLLVVECEVLQQRQLLLLEMQSELSKERQAFMIMENQQNEKIAKKVNMEISWIMMQYVIITRVHRTQRQVHLNKKVHIQQREKEIENTQTNLLIRQMLPGCLLLRHLLLLFLFTFNLQ